MATVSSNMGLNIWDSSGDPYDHVQLAANWTAVDKHDHSTGKGVQIDTGGIKNLAVSTAKLADSAVVTGKIAVNGVLTANLNNGSVTGDKLDPAVWAGVLPLGSVISWYRPTSAVAVPTGFVVCAGGSTTSHDFPGVGTLQIPNLTDRFIMGATSGVNELTTGGSNSKDLNHYHTIPTHTHNVSAHTHTIAGHSHTGATGGATPGTNTAGSHAHTFAGGLSMAQRPYEISDGSDGVRQAAYISGFNSGSSSAPVAFDSSGSHSHAVDNHTHTVSSQALTTDSAGGTTTGGINEGSPLNQTTGPSGLPTDFHPAYYGLLFIMKVRNKTV